MVEPQCDIPPAGWRCTRGPGHYGPCAAEPDILTDWEAEAALDAAGPGVPLSEDRIAEMVKYATGTATDRLRIAAMDEPGYVVADAADIRTIIVDRGRLLAACQAALGLSKFASFDNGVRSESGDSEGEHWWRLCREQLEAAIRNATGGPASNAPEGWDHGGD